MFSGNCVFSEVFASWIWEYPSAFYREWDVAREGDPAAQSGGGAWGPGSSRNLRKMVPASDRLIEVPSKRQFREWKLDYVSFKAGAKERDV
jgi:hypothetical protein